MFPDLIDIGFLHLKTYGACMAVGFVLCWKLIERLSGRKDLSDLIVYLMVAGVVGSRVAYVVEHWSSEFAAHPGNVIRVDQGGLMFYGGLILALVVFFVWCRIKRAHPLELANLFATVIPLGHACGRIGCFFYGCCYGKISGSPVAVSFPSHSVAWFEQVHAGLIPATAARSLPVLPTQLFEAAALAVLFAVLLFVYRRLGRHTAALYLMGYAVIRFGMEFLRGDPRAAFFGLSIGQLISVGMLLVGVVFLSFGRRRA